MNDLPLLATSNEFAIPIEAIRAADWARWAEGHGETLRTLAAALDFRAQPGRILIAPSTDGRVERVLFGLGDKPTAMLFGALGAQLPTGDYRLAAGAREFDPTLIAIAWALGGYAFAKYKTRTKPIARLLAPDGADMAEARRIAEASYLVRDLVNTPANDMGPEALHAAAEAVAQECGAKFTAIVGEDLLAQNYPLIHAVGRAYAQAPRLLRLSWGDENAPRVTLVGKGITFDTGGLNIKPDNSMRLMKKDMAGAAHALGLGRVVMQAELSVRLDVYLAVAENAISASSFRPSDVYRARNGVSVEIDNTDAEGRLVLADALARAGEDNPEIIFDFATLTGAARTALGPDLPPMYTDDDTLAADLERAAKDAADPIWRMPLWDAYESDIESPIADIKNTGDGGMAGSIAAALFLRRFVTAKAWAHFDIYGWSQKDKPSRPAGGEAQALRACWGVLRKRYGK